VESRRAGLEKLISEAGGNAVTIEFREVERPVTVLSGQWKYQPVAENTGDIVMVEVYGKELNAKSMRNFGEGGAGGAAEFAEVLGNWVSQEVVIDSPTFPPAASWHFNDDPPDIKRRASARDPALVYKHIEEQTGLVAKTEARKVMHVFVQTGL
jgi:hypothetical protein